MVSIKHGHYVRKLIKVVSEIYVKVKCVRQPRASTNRKNLAEKYNFFPNKRRCSRA